MFIKLPTVSRGDVYIIHTLSGLYADVFYKPAH